MKLERLVQTEMVLNNGYRVLQWYATQVCPLMKNSDPIEGYDYSGPETFQEDPHFGSAAE